MTLPAWTDIEDAIHAWIVSATGLSASNVLWEAQGAPRPTGAFISMRLGGVEAKGLDWLDVVDDPLVASVAATEVDAVEDEITSADHGLLTGDGPLYVTSTGDVPGGLAADTPYWAIRIDDDTIALAESFLDAKEGALAVDITDAGSGTITISSGDDTRRAGAEVQHRARGSRTAVLTLNAWGGLTGVGHGAGNPTALLSACLNAYRLPSIHDALNAAGVAVAQRDPVRSVDGVLSSTTSEARASVTVRLNLVAEVAESGTYIERASLTNESAGGTFVVDPDT